VILLISASWVAKIIGINHQHLAALVFFETESHWPWTHSPSASVLWLQVFATMPIRVWNSLEIKLSAFVSHFFRMGKIFPPPG
jgi:hypothetical protein